MNINNLRNVNLNSAMNQSTFQANLSEQAADLTAGNTYDDILGNVETFGFFKDFGENLNDIINEESSNVYDRYNAGSGNNGGALALADIIRALWRTITK